MEKDEKMVAQTKAKKEKAASNGKSVKLKATGNSLTGKPLDNVELNPQLDDKQVTEQSRGGVVLTFGRMNPPTVGHEKLVQKVMTVANQKKATPMVFLSHSQDKKKNPLDYTDKVRFARAAFGKVVQQSPANTLIDILKMLQSKYSDVTLVVGSDRVQEFETLLNKYNGKDYTFDSINIVSAGERDPDAEGVSGMSASKMRDAVTKGDERKFISGLPRNLQSHGKQVYDLVRAGMKLQEELEAEGLISEVLNIQQRRQRAMIMRRYAPKIKRAREIAKKRLATDKKLRKRAFIQAREIVRKRVAGRRGLEYATLSPSEKIRVDVAVEKRKKIIGKIAQRIMPKVKAAEYERLKSFMNGAQLDQKHSGPAVQHEQLNQTFEQYASSVEVTNIDDLLEEMTELVLNKIITEKQIGALRKRSERSGIDFDLLEQVYKRGLFDTMGDEQAAFNRVNAFICGGRTAMNEDRDLYEQIDRPDINELFEARQPNKPYVKPHDNGRAWKASNKWGKVKYFGKDFKASAEKHAGISEAEVWDKPSPAKKPEKLTPAQKAKAKARASRAGRPYPNMVDNIWAANEEVAIPDDLNKKLSKIAKQLHKSVATHARQRDFINQLVSKDKKDIKESLNSDHYKALTDIELNTKNRDMTTKNDGYGPLNPLDDKGSKKFWDEKAKMWNTTVEAAKEARCGNCAFFNQSPPVMKKIADGIGERGETVSDLAGFGFCELWEFKCAALRTCNTWVLGGPIKEDLDLAFENAMMPRLPKIKKHKDETAADERKEIEYMRRGPERPDEEEEPEMVRRAQIQARKKVIDEESPSDREVGTDKLVKKYKKDTPGQSLDESFNMAINAGVGITLTAADLGMKAQGGFALHPSVIEDEDETDEDV